MTDDDYKELMRFHILLHDGDISEYKYAVVDADGTLYVFITKPYTDGFEWWSSGYNYDNDYRSYDDYKKISHLPIPEDFRETIIEL